jgi:LDH2 family malate/lactate/ureidoglycolate dehydrogenase
VAVEILCGVLSGGAFGSEVGSLRKRGHPAGISQTFLAIDIGRFMPVSEFESRVARLVEMLKSTLPAPGFEEVLVAGEQEARAEKQRLSSGIPIPRRLWLTLDRLADRFQVARLQLLG